MCGFIYCLWTHHLIVDRLHLGSYALSPLTAPHLLMNAQAERDREKYERDARETRGWLSRPANLLDREERKLHCGNYELTKIRRCQVDWRQPWRERRACYCIREAPDWQKETRPGLRDSEWAGDGDGRQRKHRPTQKKPRALLRDILSAAEHSTVPGR